MDELFSLHGTYGFPLSLSCSDVFIPTIKSQNLKLQRQVDIDKERLLPVCLWQCLRLTFEILSPVHTFLYAIFKDRNRITFDLINIASRVVTFSLLHTN